jgi:parallel beta-helix repeat protein
MRILRLLLVGYVLFLYVFQLLTFSLLFVLALTGQGVQTGMVFWVEAGASGNGRSEDDPAGNITYLLEAYDLANSIVKVKPGVYDAQIERFPLVLDDEGLVLEAVGDDPSDTIIRGPGIKGIKEGEIEKSVVIKVVADKTTIKGFTIKEGNIGIFIISPYNVIYGNIIVNNWRGIGIVESWFIPDERGPVWWRGSNNTIRGNLIINNTDRGIGIASDNNLIIENNVTANKLAGISIGDGYNNTVGGNVITRNGIGVWLSGGNNRVVENTIVMNGYGVELLDSENNVVEGNVIENNSVGVSLEHFDTGNLIVNNSISYNKRYGVFVAEEAYNNTIEENVIAYNGEKNIWISLWEVPDNTIRNNIIKDHGLIGKESLSPTLIASVITISLALPIGFYLLKRKL